MSVTTSTTPAATRAAVILPWERLTPHDGLRVAEARLDEAVGLASAIGLVVVRQAVLAIRAVRPATLFGKGQVEQLAQLVDEHDVKVVIADTKLSPGQQRNLEKALNCKVLDRTGLILDIFGARAATREGVLQVELAHLEYQRSRLVRLWTHLERQRGGFGFLGGPGETQIEADRRMIDERLVRLRKELDQVRRTRGLHRSARKKVPFPIIALVGYTNAGKSTLFNVLTGSAVQARDQLFATLDPTMRGLQLPSGRRVILSDTVGFISELPTELVAAFRATLEEVAEADIILHVRDVAHPDSAAQRVDVVNVLDGMVRDRMLDEGWPLRTIEVLNKADLIGGIDAVPRHPGCVAISAITGEGLPNLYSMLDHHLTTTMKLTRIRLDVTNGAALAWLYEHGEVLERLDQETEIMLDVRLFEQDRSRFGQLYPDCLVPVSVSRTE